MNYKEATPEELIAHIDEQFIEASGKYGRIDVCWGIWSAKMNRAIRGRLMDLDNDDPESDYLALVFNYWQLVSQMLELCAKKKFFGEAKKKRKMKEIKKLKKIILS